MYLCFGEVMLRLAPPDRLRLGQCLPGTLEASFAGAEANVAASLAMWQSPVRLLTAVPKNAVAEAMIGTLRGLGVDTSAILKRDAAITERDSKLKELNGQLVATRKRLDEAVAELKKAGAR